MSDAIAVAHRGLLSILADADSLRVLDALKPSFSVEGSRRKADMQLRLRSGEMAPCRALLQQHELIECYQGQWRIPSHRVRLAYQVIGSQRDETETVHRISLLVGEQSRGCWLDIACGSGALLRSARRAGCDGTLGVDVDERALALARLADHVAQSRGAYACAPAHQLPVADASFDVVTSIVSLQHFQVRGAIREMGRVLRPKGVLFLRLEGTGYYWELALKYLCRGQAPVYPLRCLWHGLRVACGLPQDLVVQDGWLKFEIPVSIAWVRRAVAAVGVHVESVRVLRSLAGCPVFFEVFGRGSERMGGGR